MAATQKTVILLAVTVLITDVFSLMAWFCLKLSGLILYSPIFLHEWFI